MEFVFIFSLWRLTVFAGRDVRRGIPSEDVVTSSRIFQFRCGYCLGCTAAAHGTRFWVEPLGSEEKNRAFGGPAERGNPRPARSRRPRTVAESALFSREVVFWTFVGPFQRGLWIFRFWEFRDFYLRRLWVWCLALELTRNYLDEFAAEAGISRQILNC